jgi:Ca2+-binding RTX toxin-like protein
MDMKRTTTSAMRATALAASSAAIAFTAIASPALAGAGDQRIGGVGAAVKHGTLDVKGSDGPNHIALRLAAGDTNVIQVDVGDDGSADYSIARARVEAISVRGGDGDDAIRIDDANGAFTNTVPTAIAGGDGDDSLRGGLGNETYRGGDGDDTVAGGKGADTAYLGAGDDTFRWDNGEGSDVIEGQEGDDTMVFNGAGINENVTLTADAGRLKFFRVQGNVLMDTDGVERVDDNAAGGADSVTVNDLSSTDVRQTKLDLGGADTAVDSVVVNATEGDDNIAIDGFPTRVDVSGLANLVSIRSAEPTDNLSVNTLGGNDNVVTSGVAGLLNLFVDGAPA